MKTDTKAWIGYGALWVVALTLTIGYAAKRMMGEDQPRKMPPGWSLETDGKRFRGVDPDGYKRWPYDSLEEAIKHCWSIYELNQQQNRDKAIEWVRVPAGAGVYQSGWEVVSTPAEQRIIPGPTVKITTNYILEAITNQQFGTVTNVWPARPRHVPIEDVLDALGIERRLAALEAHSKEVDRRLAKVESLKPWEDIRPTNHVDMIIKYTNGVPRWVPDENNGIPAQTLTNWFVPTTNIWSGPYIVTNSAWIVRPRRMESIPPLELEAR